MAVPTIRQLRTFLTVVETGSVSAAAHRLNLTQPAASQQLRELERTLRVRLLDRAGGRMVPTAAGQALLEPARRTQEAIEDVTTIAAAYRAGDAGRVRLGTGATACIHLLPPVLAAAKRRMPGLEVILATGNSGDMIRRVEIGALDIALVTLPVAAGRALSVTPVMTDRLLALVPDAAAGDRDTIGPAELAALPLILYEPGGTTRPIIDAWFRGGGITPRPIMQLDNVETIKVLVGSGLGASMLPGLALSAPVPGATVRRPRPALERQLAIALRRDKTVDAGLRVLMDALMACNPDQQRTARRSA